MQFCMLEQATKANALSPSLGQRHGLHQHKYIHPCVDKSMVYGRAAYYTATLLTANIVGL